MITARGVTIGVGEKVLVRDASFVVGRTDKVGLVGRNGAGKTSLIRFVLGDRTGSLHASGDVRIEGVVGFLPQVPEPTGYGIDSSALSHVLSSRGLDALDKQLHDAQVAMAASPTDEHIAIYSALEERYRALGGYGMEAEIARLADGLGLCQDLLLEDLAALSGGQRRRVDLVRVLFQGPQTMVLDEPTNHLDVVAKRWLMDELAVFPGALLIVSHDIPLLDQTITQVLHLADGALRRYKGTYTQFRAQLAAEVAQREKAASAEQAQVEKMRMLADKWRHSTEAQARKAKVLDRKVEKLQGRRTLVPRKERRVSFRLPEPRRSGAVPLAVRNLSVTYGSDRVIDDVEFILGRGERLVVVGRNGAGKSSFLRCLAGVQEPSLGAVELGHNAVVGYFAQEHEQIDADRTVLENIDDAVLARDPERRKLLGSFGLTGNVAVQDPASLSGGERARLSLAMLADGRANVLVLDEPTNNLDPASVQAVGAMLASWPGTIVAVSHDRPFVEALSPTHALHLPAEHFGLWREEYLDEVEARQSPSRADKTRTASAMTGWTDRWARGPGSDVTSR